MQYLLNLKRCQIVDQRLGLIAIIVILLTRCKAYKQDIMFQLDDEFNENNLTKAVYQAEKNYIIQTDDRLRLSLFANDGELLIDPEGGIRQGGGGQNLNQRGNLGLNEYLVMETGEVKLPVIGHIQLSGYTIDQAELILQEKYNEYYNGSFVKLQFINKRVIFLGALGGQVISLNNENMSLIEVIALAGGANQGDKMQNVTVLRGDLADPDVFKIDLTTITGMRQSIITIEPGDIIYVEPWRRVFYEGMSDIVPIMSFITSTIAFILVLQNL